MPLLSHTPVELPFCRQLMTILFREVQMSTTHKSFSFLIIAALVLIVSFTLVNCKGGGGSSNSGAGNADYVLTVDPASVSVFQGLSVMIKASVARNAGTSAKVSITVANPPAGVHADVLTLPGNASSGYLRLSLDPDIAIGGPLDLAVTGTSGASSATVHLPLDCPNGRAELSEKIQASLAAGTIDYGTSLLYRAYALYGDSRLPAEYLDSGSNEEDNDLRSEIITAGTSSIGLAPELQAALEPFTVRPAYPKSWFNEVPVASPKARSGKSGKGSTLSGLLQSAATGWQWDSILGTNPVRVWAQTNGASNYDAESMAAMAETLGVLDKIWGPMTALMGPPLPDQDGGDTAIDVYIVDNSSSVKRRAESFVPAGLGSTFSDFPRNGKKRAGLS